LPLIFKVEFYKFVDCIIEILGNDRRVAKHIEFPFVVRVDAQLPFLNSNFASGLELLDDVIRFFAVGPHFNTYICNMVNHIFRQIRHDSNGSDLGNVLFPQLFGNGSCIAASSAVDHQIFNEHCFKLTI